LPAETTNRPIPQQETQGIRSAGFDSSSESDGAATFRSILFGGDADDASAVNQSAPEYFRDLNLDQIVESITVGRDEYDLRPIFHAPLATIDAIHYRQAVFRDLDVPALLDQPVLEKAEKSYYKVQKNALILSAAEVYCAAVSRLNGTGTCNSRCRLTSNSNLDTWPTRAFS
jgi:hypothetical protein